MVAEAHLTEGPFLGEETKSKKFCISGQGRRKPTDSRTRYEGISMNLHAWKTEHNNVAVLVVVVVVVVGMRSYLSSVVNYAIKLHA